MSVPVLGAGGLLGHRVRRQLSEHMQTYAALRRSFDDVASLGWFDRASVIERVDVLAHADLDRAFSIAKPDVVINAVGIVKQRDDAANAVQTISVNALLPHVLA